MHTLKGPASPRVSPAVSHPVTPDTEREQLDPEGDELGFIDKEDGDLQQGDSFESPKSIDSKSTSRASRSSRVSRSSQGSSKKSTESTPESGQTDSGKK